jgi:argininosuccinate lyase
VAEITRGKTARVYGDLMALLTMCKGLPLTYNRDLQEDKEAIFDAIDTVKMVLSVYPPMLGTLTPKKENMEKAANDPALMATDIAEELVKLGVPFRNAHHRVGSYVKYCKDNNKNLDECTLEEMQITIPEANEEFLKLFDPRISVAKRNITGATGFEQVAKQVKFWQEKLK